MNKKRIESAGPTRNDARSTSKTNGAKSGDLSRYRNTNDYASHGSPDGHPKYKPKIDTLQINANFRSSEQDGVNSAMRPKSTISRGRAAAAAMSPESKQSLVLALCLVASLSFSSFA